MTMTKNDPVNAVPPNEAINQQRIVRLLHFIQANYQRSITIKDAAAHLFLSERQINRIMKTGVNATFHEYLARYRIGMARSLLAETGWSVERVAAESGFGTVRNLYQVFKKSGFPPPNQMRGCGGTTSAAAGARLENPIEEGA